MSEGVWPMILKLTASIEAEVHLGRIAKMHIGDGTSGSLPVAIHPEDSNFREWE
jgi:hypothetical protein